jgi:hypothetical protein
MSSLLWSCGLLTPLCAPAYNHCACRRPYYQRLIELPENLVGEMVVVQTWIWSFLRPSYVNDAPPVRVTYVHIWNTTGEIIDGELYAHYGVAYLWLVDPLARTLEAYMLQDGRWVVTGLFKDSDEVSVEPFREIIIALEELWVDA